MKSTAERETIPVSFKMSNIGPVREAVLRLGRLTVVAGRNNTGKTYIVYTLYGFLKAFKAYDWTDTSRFVKGISKELPHLGAILEGIRSARRAEVPISLPTLTKQRMRIADIVTGDFSQQIQDIFNTDRDSFRNAALSVTFDDAQANYIPSPTEARSHFGTIKMEYDSGSVHASFSDINQQSDSELAVATVHAYFVFLMRDLFPDPFILSAERFGISLFYRELDFTKNRIVDLLQKYGNGGSRNTPLPYLIVDRTSSRYAVPIKDNINFTRSIPDLPRDSSPRADRKLFNRIKDMMAGYYSNATGDIRFMSRARKEGHFNIPLHLASSSARGLSDLYFFLRYAVNHSQLLIIDEPESHLDTANQVLFARLLARFVEMGLRVVITTHSDYILKELNNLIMLSRISEKNGKIARELGYEEGEGLKADSVRAYIAAGGTLSPCCIGQYGIEMPVFDATINNINRVAIELASRL